MKLSNLKLAHKQSIGFGIILVIMAAVNIYSIVKMSLLKNDIDEITNKWFPSVISISDINTQAANFRIAELQHAFDATENGKRMFEREMEKTQENIEITLSEYENYIIGKQSLSLYKSISEKWGHYIKLNRDFLKFSRYNMKEEAIYLLNDEARKLFEDLISDVQKLVEENRKNAYMAAQRANDTYKSTITLIVTLIIVTILISIFIIFLLMRFISVPVRQLAKAAENVAEGNDRVTIKITSQDEIGKLAQSFNKMTRSIRESKASNEIKDWLKTGQNELNQKMRGDLEIQTLAKNIITYLCEYLKAQIGALYLYNEDTKKLKLTGSYAFTKRKNLNSEIKIGEGLVGQAAYEKEIISITDIPFDYIRINSALGNLPPKNIVVAPLLFQQKLIGVIEFGTIKEFDDQQLEFLNAVLENIAIGFNTAISNHKIKFLLTESQRQAIELKKQQEELKASNEELESQTLALRQSESRLQAQQEELQVSNEELAEKTNYLEKQKKEISKKNDDLEEIQIELKRQTQELRNASRYKSEFLANMSHELRTPLNSLLILARDLADNKEKTLTDDQVEAAGIIYKSGSDLLRLINDILDLSKIEAGKMTINLEKLLFESFSKNIQKTFGHMVKEKDLDLIIKIEENLPAQMTTDAQRLEQVIKNLLSNAIKFTKQGSITVHAFRPNNDFKFLNSTLKHENSVAISVIDTGIGIPPEKQDSIFEAFKQADGSTSRRFGGTGLGLSISKEICRMLGGEIQLQSQAGKGSTFTIILPLNSTEFVNNMPADKKQKTSSKIPQILEENHEAQTKNNQIQDIPNDIIATNSFKFKDDRTNLQANEKTILVIEDDPNFAKIILNQCHKKNFKCIAAATGEEGLRLAEKYKPNAIILDIRLPGISGWTVLQSLKESAELRHIPVHLMSAEEANIDAMNKGAIGFLTKPITKKELDSAFTKMENVMEKKIKDLLIVEDNEIMRKNIKNLIGAEDVKTTEAATGEIAIQKIKQSKFDCIVLDLGLPDMSGIELLNKLNADADQALPPVIIYTGKDLTESEHKQLKKYSDSIIIKGVKSEDRLLDETALFLHRVVKDLPEKMQNVISHLHNKDEVFSNKRIMLVDDDMRNVFALSKVLKERGIIIVKAENGQKAIQIAQQDKNIDLILMDIMMPVMDGYQAMQEIRKIEHYKNIPMIALTAKAMKEDREKCINAGASDYLTKPIDISRLISMMRVWLYK